MCSCRHEAVQAKQAVWLQRPPGSMTSRCATGKWFHMLNSSGVTDNRTRYIPAALVIRFPLAPSLFPWEALGSSNRGGGGPRSCRGPCCVASKCCDRSPRPLLQIRHSTQFENLSHHVFDVEFAESTAPWRGSSETLMLHRGACTVLSQD